MPDAPDTTKILIVEDEESVRMAIEAGLEVIGKFDVHMAPDGEAGFAALKEFQPDILLLDLVMPFVDGMEFLRRMVKDPDVIRPGKVVLMTAMSNPVPESSFKELGLDAVLAKPFRLHELASAVGAESPF